MPKLKLPEMFELPMPRNLTLVRHGEHVVDFSVPNRSLDLSQKGIETIEASRDALVNEIGKIAIFYDAFFTSPYQRSLQTTQILCPEAEWLVDDNLSERDWGEYGALPPELREDVYPEVHAQLEQDYYNTRLPGGENVSDVWRRQVSFLNSIKHEVDGSYIISTHGGFMRAFQVMFERHNSVDKIENGEIWIYREEGKTVIKPTGKNKTGCSWF